MTAPETIFVTADVDELADTIDLYAQTTPDGMTGEPERYTRTKLVHETHIRRDDPALRQVMEAINECLRELEYLGKAGTNGYNNAIAALKGMEDLYK